MNKVTSSLLALSALAGSAMIASAAAPDVGTNYNLNAEFTNSATCVVPKLVSVYGLPLANAYTFVAGNYTVVNTDGKGTIDGTADLIVSNPNPAFVVGFGMYAVDISGTITSVKTNPSVKMTMKGTGYIEAPDKTSQKASTLNLTFTSDTTTGLSSATNLTGPFTNAVNVVHVNVDGTTNYTQRVNAQSKYIRTPYQTATIVYHYSQTTTTTNGGVTNISVHDVIAEPVSVDFATATSTNVHYTINNVLGDDNGTNVYNIVGIQSVTTATSTNTDYGWGLDVGSLASYINSFSVSNAGLVQVVLSVTTNNADSGETIVGTGVVLSNNFQILSGTLKGSITATGVKAAQVNTPARFVTDNTVYTTIAPYQTISNFFTYNTNVTYTTNGGVITTNTVVSTNTFPTTILAAVYALDQGGLSVDNKDYLDARVVQVNSKIYTSGSDEDTYNGTGTLTTKAVKSTATKVGSTNTTYKATLNGRAWNRGSSVTLSGTNGFHILNITSTSNNTPVVVSVTNQAVLPYPPGLSFTITNTSGHGYFTNPVVVYPSTTNAGVITTVTSDFGGVSVPGYNTTQTTNAAPLGIKSVTLSGKIMGQTIAVPSKTVIGVNGFNLDYFSY